MVQGSREFADHGVGAQWSSWTNSLYQLVSQVLPPSFEKACSHFATIREPCGLSACFHFSLAGKPFASTVHVKRTVMGMPLYVSGPSKIPTLASNLPTTGG